MNKNSNLINTIGMICVIAGTLLSSCSQKEEEKEVYRPFGKDTTYVDHYEGARVKIYTEWGNDQTKVMTYDDTLTEGDVVIYLKKEHWRKKVKDGRDTSYTHDWWVDQVRIGAWKIYPYYEKTNVQVEGPEGTAYFLIKGDTIKESRFSLNKTTPKDDKPSGKDAYYMRGHVLCENAEPILLKATQAVIRVSESNGVSCARWKLN